ncbi:hypothetical protein HDU98_008759, partial [Podochytrium sp. JEL0797]
MANWFRERHAKVIPAGSIIANAYNPREDIEESWFEGVTNETPRDKTITDKTAIYILNRVLLPKVLYIAKTLAITRAQMDL